MNEENLVFLDEDEDIGDENKFTGQWNILIVDDEPEVHMVTKLALDGFSFANKSLNFISAYTGEEARKFLSETDLDIAVTLLDVVMETDSAGLDTAKWIREDLKNTHLRIVLRTGQPGQAPERDIISSYDINDYKEKTELTAQKLFTLMFATLRSYQDIRAIANHKRGLEKIIEASENIFEYHSLEKFTGGVLLQLSSLFHINQGAVYGRSEKDGSNGNITTDDIKILACSSEFCETKGKKLGSVLPDNYDFEELNAHLREGRSGFIHNTYVGIFKTKDGVVNLIFMLGVDHPNVDLSLINIFIRNIGIAFENIHRLETVNRTQREIIFRLGEAVETRWDKAGSHVKRVAKISILLAKAYGLNEEECEIIGYASPLHDIGKISIPDAILRKQASLNSDEWKVMETHAKMGENMLSGSGQPILKAAATIASQHHERWDGSGYPSGKSGEDIDVMARITAIADVFDAGSSPQCYKEPWDEDKILDFFRSERGKQFEPKLVDLLIENIDEIREIRKNCTNK